MGAPEEEGGRVGIIRKTMSLSTLGLVDFRSDKERTARYTRQTRNAARAQVAQQAMDLELQSRQLAALDHANVREAVKPVTTEPGWYADPGDPTLVRWFDGRQWTGHVQAMLPPSPPPAPEYVATPPRSIPPPGAGVADELAKLADLHDKGILSHEEFESAKARLLAP
jgi:type II secretory pathway pseudopilin PulG